MTTVEERLALVASGAVDVCKIPECSERRYSRGWCRRHYSSWYKHGDPLAASQYPAEIVGYVGAHDRVRALRGRASDYRCQTCDRPALDWCYDRSGAAEVTDERGRAYSLDPGRYLHLCRTCHRRYDGLP